MALLSNLAQINVARLIAPIDDPLIADFVAQLDEINALAERSKGFVWRLKDDSNSAVGIQPFEDTMIIVNMSVWETVDDFKGFVYRSDHVKVFKKRAKWFEKMDKRPLALWWIKPDDIPDAVEGKKRLEHLWKNGETAYSFTFKKLFEPGEALTS